jgi:hypothetical protein
MCISTFAKYLLIQSIDVSSFVITLIGILHENRALRRSGRMSLKCVSGKMWELRSELKRPGIESNNGLWG